MSKVKIPKPVAVVESDYALFWAGSGPIAPLCERTGAKVGSQLIATDQAKAYTAARVKEAPEEAARVKEAPEEAAPACEARIGQHAPDMSPEDVEDCDEEARLCAGAVRALIVP